MDKNQDTKSAPGNRKFQDLTYPKVSIIIPTYNSAHPISNLIEGLLGQIYPDFEIIIVDARSRDHTMEIVREFRSEKVSIYSVSRYHPYEMLNKGITQARGEYINFLFPDDYYIYKKTLQVVMEAAIEHNKPPLVYCGTLIRDGRSDVKTLLRPLTMKILKKGQQPTSLQSCWFRSDVFKILGKFDTFYEQRGGFDFMCRFGLKKHLNSVAVKRFLVDYDLRVMTREMVLKHFEESFRAIRVRFGLLAAVRWFFIQKDLYRFVKLWWRSILVAFTGR